MKKLTFIFALLCASVMGWAVDWTGQVTGSANNVWLEGISSDADRTSVVNYTVNYLMEYNGSALTVTIGFTDDNFGKTVGLVPQIFVNGAYKGNFSGNSWSSTDYSAGEELEIHFYFAYNGTPPDNVSASSHFNYTVPGGSTPAVTGICESAVYATDVAGYDIHAKVTKGANKYYLTLTSATDGKTLTGLSGDNMFCYQYGDESRTEAQRSGDFKMAQSGRYTISEGAITFTIPSVGDPQMYTDLDVIYSDNHVAHISALKGVRLVPCSTEDPVAYDPDPTEIEDVNFALFSNGAFAYASAVENGLNGKNAIDGNDGSAFSTAHSDPQWFIVDLGRRRIFNTIQIRWQTAYSRTFTIDVSNDGETWTTKKGENYYEGGGDNVEYEVSLSENVTARYVRLYSTARATQWGNSFYSFRVLLKGVPVLTSVDLSSNTTIAKVGEYATLTPSPKDQNNGAIDADLSYSVSPAGAGYVTEGKYYPLKYGLATITVTAEAGGVQKTNNVQIWGVTSTNLAKDNALSDDGTYTSDGGSEHLPAKAVDGLNNTWWQGSTNGESGAADEAARTYDAYFTIDLGGIYNLQLVRIIFDGACSDKYKLKVSANNSDWADAYTYDQATGNHPHTKYIATEDLNNSDNVRYLKFYSTKASTQWGVKIYELEVYGTEASNMKTVSASVNPASTGSVTVMAGDPLVAVTEVASGTPVTFTATPAEGYDFINWTQGGVEVSTSLEYSTTITSNIALVANFEAHRTTYCRSVITADNGATVYLTMKKTGATQDVTGYPQYRIEFEGMEGYAIAGAGNFDVWIGHVNGSSGNTQFNDVTWTFDNNTTAYPYGMIYTEFYAEDWREITFPNHYFYFVPSGIVELNANFPTASLINWNNSCTDETAPVLSTPSAEALNESTIRLTLSATDDYSNVITYHIVCAAASIDESVDGASGATVTKEYTGLTSGTEYTFTITAADGKTLSAHVSDPQYCSATPVGDTEAPEITSFTATPSYGYVDLAITATDDLAGDLTYTITYGDENVNVVGVAGSEATKRIYTLPNTSLSFSVVATDAASHTSDAAVASATTSSIPGSPTPSHPKNQVRSVYSDAYNAAVASTFWSSNFGSAPRIALSDYMLYRMGANVIVWGNNSGSAENGNIDGLAGYTYGENTGLDVSCMKYIHFDIWCDESNQLNTVNINDQPIAIPTTRTVAGEWVSFDVAIGGAAEADRQNVRWLKFHPFNSTNCLVAIDNVYFWTDAVPTTPDGWATYSPLEKVAVPSGVTAYWAEYQKVGGDEQLVLHAITENVIPAGAGVILYGANNGMYDFTATDAAAPDLSSNVLTGCPTQTDITTVAETNDIFCIRYIDGYSSAFYQYYGTTVAAHKAYLALPKAGGGSGLPQRKIRFVFHNEQTTTGIENADAEALQTTKFMENGQLFIRRGDAVYTIQGARVQ